MNRSIEQRRTETQNKVILAYHGYLTDEIFTNILQLAELKLELVESDIRLKKRVFNVLVEVLQNIYHHFDGKLLQSKLFNISFKLRKIKTGYLILAGNPVLKNKIKHIRENIDSINNMSSNELKVVYRTRLSDNQFSEKGGAGLGLLALVRKTGTKVDYNFQAFNSDYSFFNLKVKVSA